MSLLNTIKLPKNLKLLTDRLPKSKYDEDAQSQSSYSHVLTEVKSTKSLNSKVQGVSEGKRASG